ncbi:MAG TPA: phage holin family protein [Gemmatimonadales bacterium]
MPQITRGDRSIGELFSQLSHDLGVLVRQEAELAKTEMTAKLTRLGGNVASLTIGGVVAFVGAQALIAAVILVLAELGIAPWLSALIVGALLAIAGFMMVQKARAGMKDVSLKPKRTIETLKDDVQWAKELRP